MRGTVLNIIHVLSSIERVTLNMQVDNSFTAYADGEKVGSGSNWQKTDTISVVQSTSVIAIEAANAVSFPSWINVFYYQISERKRLVF